MAFVDQVFRCLSGGRPKKNWRRTPRRRSNSWLSTPPIRKRAARQIRDNAQLKLKQLGEGQPSGRPPSIIGVTGTI
jgi:hypothetical protein